MNKLFFTLILTLMPTIVWSCSKDSDTPEPIVKEVTISVSPESLAVGYEASNMEITVTSTADWSIRSNEDWCSVTPSGGSKDQSTKVTVKISANNGSTSRSGNLTITSSGKTVTIPVSQTASPVDQYTDEITAPEGYSLVWHDEFNEGTLPGSDWVLENWPAGYVNNELQTYTSKEVDGKRTAEVKDGFLWINCFKGTDGKIYSARLNAKPSTGWLYGYFEARINLPKGLGTWPAYWMMPSNVDWNTNPWPYCGEIDIMEEVGANPNYVSSSLHTGNYNHTKGTQKTHEMYCAGAEGEFHIYALEWTEEGITTYVDGKVQLQVTKASMGADHDSWPFHYAFYPILNLAWGGDWGGYKGVDDNDLPVSMKVDYARIFQKN